MIIECCQSMKKDFLDNCLQMVTVFVYRRNQLKVEKRWMQSTVSRIQAPASLIQVAKKWPSRLKPHPRTFCLIQSTGTPIQSTGSLKSGIIQSPGLPNPIDWNVPGFEFCSFQPFQNLKFKKPNNTPIKYQHFT